jgi:hypothetical protein
VSSVWAYPAQVLSERKSKGRKLWSHRPIRHESKYNPYLLSDRWGKKQGAQTNFVDRQVGNGCAMQAGLKILAAKHLLVLDIPTKQFGLLFSCTIQSAYAAQCLERQQHFLD